MLNIGEYFEYVEYYGNTTCHTTIHYDAVFLGKVINFDDIKNKDAGQLKDYFRKVNEEVGEVLMRRPEIVKNVVKGSAIDCAKVLSNRIKTFKEFINGYTKTLDNMEQSLKIASNIAENNQLGAYDKKRLTMFKRILRLQRSIYVHDTNLTKCAAQCVIKQSEELKKFISKNTIKESAEVEIMNEANRYNTFFLFSPKWYSDMKLSSYCKPRMAAHEIFKAHEYPGYLNMIDHCKTMDDIDYIREDISVSNLKLIADRIKNCEEYGKCDSTKNYYDGINKLYISKGVTSEDVLLYDKWIKTVARERLNNKAKEIRSGIKESTEVIDEAFGMSRKEKHNALMDMEEAYDKKYNGFCLAISKYSEEQLNSMLEKKKAELESAKDDLKKAKDRDAKLELKVKIDYLNNVCDRCKLQIKKKKSYK